MNIDGKICFIISIRTFGSSRMEINTCFAFVDVRTTIGFFKSKHRSINKINVYTVEETVGIQYYGGMVVPPLKILSLIQHEYDSLIARTQLTA